MRGVMLSLQSIWREASVVQGIWIVCARSIHGLKATQMTRFGGRLEPGHPPQVKV
jgi:hypothetical protein